VISDTEIVRRLKDLRRRKPFEPFVITTADGKRHEVTAALSFAFDPTTGPDANQTVVIMPPTGCLDTFRRNTIVSVDVLEPAH